MGEARYMKIIWQQKDHPFKREIEMIFDLFKTETDQLLFEEKAEEEAYLVNIDEQYGKDFVLVKGEVIKNQQATSYTYERSVSMNLTEEEKRKVAKQAVKHLWLKILEDITGEKQDWGILTGIRPTKLYHQLLQEMTMDQVDQFLEKEYLLRPNKIALLREIVQRQLKVIPDLYEINQEVSLYIGIPFCPTKCAYCTFPAYSIKGRNGTVDGFLKGLHLEIEKIGKWLKESSRKVTTIYFGGGTPTSIEAEQLDQIFAQLNQWIDLADLREITVEAGRPDTITLDKINVLNKWKVDRISINPQTFTQETLDLIGRHHTVEETIEKFHLARKMKIDNINMDLIIGLPGERTEQLQYSLDQLTNLQPESITVHTMAFKRASYLTKNKAEYDIIDKDEIRKMMDLASRWAREHHYHPYYLYRQKNMLGNLENVGYALENRESIYNILIMEEKQTIIGLGCGAVSKLIPPNSNIVIRFPNPKEPKVYIETIETQIDLKIEKLNEIFQVVA